MIDLPRVVAEADVGSVAVVEVWRKNKIVLIKVKLGELPEKSYVERKDNDIQVNSLGISISKTENNKGVLVTKIDDEVTKLQIGDIINEINREEITGPKTFEIIIKKIKKTGRSSLLLKVLRDNKSIWITVKFIEN